MNINYRTPTLIQYEHDGQLIANFNNMNLSEHFTKDELIASSTAQSKGISNEPNDIELGHLKLLCTFLLEPLRQAWGSGINVSSGFRSEELNNVTPNASKTSSHRLGYAADIKPTNGKMKEFKEFVKGWLKLAAWGNNITLPFDQCIDEQDSKGNQWIHIGLCNYKGEMRRQFLKTTDGKNYQVDRV